MTNLLILIKASFYVLGGGLILTGVLNKLLKGEEK